MREGGFEAQSLTLTLLQHALYITASIVMLSHGGRLRYIEMSRSEVRHGSTTCRIHDRCNPERESAGIPVCVALEAEE